MLEVFPQYFIFGICVGVVISFVCFVCRVAIDSFKKFF